MIADDVAVATALAGLRRIPLDGALMLFDRASGLTALCDGPATAHLRQRGPRVIQFGITNACNLACGFCSRDVGAASTWTADEAFTLLADLAAAGACEVAFGGGEPLVFRGFAELVARLHRETPLALSVTTNGTRLDDAMVAALAPHVGQLRVSIYDQIDHRPILARLAGRVRFGVNWLVTPARKDALEATVLELYEAGCRDVLLLSYNGRDPALHLAPDDVAELAERVRLLDRALAGRVQLKLDVCWGERMAAVPQLVTGPCPAGRDFVVITSDRRLAPCSFHHTSLPIAGAADVLRWWASERAALAEAANDPGCARRADFGLGGLTPLRPRRASRAATAPSSPSSRPRIRWFSAFASNNSGSYTLVGRFRDVDTAAAIGALIEEVCIAHHAWSGRADDVGPGPAPSPLDDLVVGQALHAKDPGRDDEWPQYGPRPTAVAAGYQVLVHAPYVATMTPVFAELIFARGGRIEVEIDHAHEPLAVELTYWPTARGRDDSARLDAFDVELTAALPPLVGLDPHADHLVGAPEPTAVAPAFHRDENRKVSVVFRDLIEGVRAVRALAAQHAMSLWLRVHECPRAVRDPFALLRGTPPPTGLWTVIVWSVGADRVAALKAVRALRGCGLTDARDAIAELPVEIVVGVSERHARDGADRLRAAGCDAEAVLPATR